MRLKKNFLVCISQTNPILSKIWFLFALVFRVQVFFPNFKLVCKAIVSLDLVIESIPQRLCITFIQNYNRHNVYILVYTVCCDKCILCQTSSVHFRRYERVKEWINEKWKCKKTDRPTMTKKAKMTETMNFLCRLIKK